MCSFIFYDGNAVCFHWVLFSKVLRQGVFALTLTVFLTFLGWRGKRRLWMGRRVNRNHSIGWRNIDIRLPNLDIPSLGTTLRKASSVPRLMDRARGTRVLVYVVTICAYRSDEDSWSYSLPCTCCVLVHMLFSVQLYWSYSFTNVPLGSTRSHLPSAQYKCPEVGFSSSNRTIPSVPQRIHKRAFLYVNFGCALK